MKRAITLLLFCWQVVGQVPGLSYWTWSSGTNANLPGVAYANGFVATNSTTITGLTLAPGTTTVAPLKFQSGPLLTTPAAGAMEYLEHTIYFTTYLVRRSFHLDQAVIVNPVTVSNTLTETTIYTIPMAANYLTVGKVIMPRLTGLYWSAGNKTFTIRLYHGTNVLATTQSTSTPSSAKPWESLFMITILSTGTNATCYSSARLIQDTSNNMDALPGVDTFDSTQDNSFSMTVQWDSTGANSLMLRQGFTECIQ